MTYKCPNNNNKHLICLLWHMQEKLRNRHRLILQQVWCSESGTNNEVNLSACHLPAAWEMSEGNSALISVAQLALKGRGRGDVWKHPSVSITPPEASTQISLFQHVKICQRCHIRHDEWEREQESERETDSSRRYWYSDKKVTEVKRTL